MSAGVHTSSLCRVTHSQMSARPLTEGTTALMADSGPLIDTYGHFIDGRWVEPDAGRYDVVNPATEQPVGTAPDASVARVEAAVGAAREAFDAGRWSELEPS